MYNQSSAILKGLGAQHGYAVGNTFDEQYLSSWYADTITDFAKQEQIVIFFKDDHPDAETIEKIAAAFKKGLTEVNNEFCKKSSEFMMGPKITTIDFALLAFLTTIVMNEHDKHPELTEALKSIVGGLPHLVEWHARMSANLATTCRSQAQLHVRARIRLPW